MTGVSSLPDSKTQALWGGNVHYAETAGNVVNNQTTTKAGFALDARQANPNLDGTLAKQVADLNGSLNTTIKRANTLDGNEALGTTCYGKPFFNLSG